MWKSVYNFKKTSKKKRRPLSKNNGRYRKNNGRYRETVSKNEKQRQKRENNVGYTKTTFLSKNNAKF